jgi:hypothetical protein
LHVEGNNSFQAPRQKRRKKEKKSVRARLNV